MRATIKMDADMAELLLDVFEFYCVGKNPDTKRREAKERIAVMRGDIARAKLSVTDAGGTAEDGGT